MDGSSKRDGENDVQKIQGNGAGDSPNNVETKLNEEESSSSSPLSSSTLSSSDAANKPSSSSSTTPTSSNNVPPTSKDNMPPSLSIKEETTTVINMNRVNASDSNSSQVPTGGTVASVSSSTTTTTAAVVGVTTTAPTTTYSTSIPSNAFAQIDPQQLHGQLTMPSFIWDQAMLTYYYSQNPAASPVAYYRGANPMNHLANYLTGTMPYLYSHQPTSPAMWLPDVLNNLTNNNILNAIHDGSSQQQSTLVTNVSRDESGNNNIGQITESVPNMDNNQSSKPTDNNDTSTADKSWASVARPKSSTSDTSAHSTTAPVPPPPSTSSLSQPVHQQQQEMGSC
jgi:hypothetical protein